MHRFAGQSSIAWFLVDWVVTQPAPEPRLPVVLLSREDKAAALARIDRERAKLAAREAELILGLAGDCPDSDDPPAGSPGARSRAWRTTDPEFPGVSEFFPAEVAHALNLGRGTAVFRARRAYTWRDKLPATFALLRSGEIDERRAGVLAEVLQHTRPAVAQAVEAAVLPEATDLALGKVRRRALELLAELDADAIEERRSEARKAADVRAFDTGEGRGCLAGDMSSEELAACYEVIDQLATMAKADGDDRPIGQLRAEIMTMLILRPADNGLNGVTVNLAINAALEGLEGTSGRGGDVNGFPITAAHLRALLSRFGALGMQAPEGGSLAFALTDENGRLLAAVSADELSRLDRRGCSEHSDGDCACGLLGEPPATEAYEPTDQQKICVRTRDRTCRMPNCGQRVGWADLDHVVPHSCGGETTCTNLCRLCRRDHRLTTFARGWQFRMTADGTLSVTSPSGITRTTRPPGLRRPDPDPPPISSEACPF